MAFSGHACSKFILGGEHAVVHGAHAIAIPLFGKKLSLQLSSSSRTRALVLSGKTKSDQIADVLTDLKKLTPADIFSAKHEFSASGNCSIPVGAGLGASAALCVALARAHEKWTSNTLSSSSQTGFAEQFEKQKVQKLAHSLEKRFHGSPSGIDTSVIAYEQPILFQKNEGVRFAASVIQMPRFVLVDSGVRSSTKHMVQKAMTHFAGNKGERLVRRFDLVTLDTWKALHQNDMQGLVETMRENHSLLQEIEVVGQRCMELVEKMTDLGTVAAKVTGAGGGGFVLGVLPKDPSAAAVTQKNLEDHFGKDAVIAAFNETHTHLNPGEYHAN